MGKWLELAAELEAGQAISAPDAAPIGPIGPIVPAHPFPDQSNPRALPDEVRAGLNSLRAMGTPRYAQPSVWRESVEDACELARSGWAADALALGWQPIDLFGCEPRGSDDDRRNGLCVWLARRKLLLIDDRMAIAANGSGRAYFHRGIDRTGAVLLWALDQHKRKG